MAVGVAEYAEKYLPELLREQYLGPIEQAHNLYRSVTGQSLLGLINSGKSHIYMPTSERYGYAVVEPILSKIPSNVDDKKAILSVGVPFSLQGFIGAAFLADAYPGGIKHIILPDFSSHGVLSKFNSDDRRKLAKADDTPIIERQLVAIQESGLKVVQMNFMPSGCLTAAELSYKIGRDNLIYTDSNNITPSIVCVNWLNGEPRSVEQFKAAHARHDTAASKKAIKDTEIPAYIEAGASQWGVLSMQAMFQKFFAHHIYTDSSIVNYASMGTFVDDTLQFFGKFAPKPRRNLTLVRSENDTILTESIFQHTIKRLHNEVEFESITVPGYGHELTEQIVAWACLLRLIDKQNTTKVA